VAVHNEQPTPCLLVHTWGMCVLLLLSNRPVTSVSSNGWLLRVDADDDADDDDADADDDDADDGGDVQVSYADDVYRLQFGVRTVRISGSQMMVNDRPFYCVGVGKHEDSDVCQLSLVFSLSALCLSLAIITPPLLLLPLLWPSPTNTLYVRRYICR